MIITEDDKAKIKASGYNLQPLIQEFSQSLLNKVIKDEVKQFLITYSGEKLPNGANRLVLNGSYTRDILTKSGKLTIAIPKVRDRGSGDDKLSFQLSIIPKYLRKVEDVEDIIPYLYLQGISTTNLPSALDQVYGWKSLKMSPPELKKLL
jgi:transposase-like protein